MVLRNSVIWKQKISYPYSLRDIIEFKVPEFFVWPLIAGLALFLGGEYFLGEKAEVIAVNILYCLSIFYFFQGFGVLADFLTHIRIVGFSGVS